MVEGQEKDRLAMAIDLHDDSGSLMATIKLHFGSFKDSKTSQYLFLKTNTLIDEAYHKIRTISHAKNSGVLSKQGLYEAILKLSKSISDSESITINVHENGLSQRLENFQELTIFRIIQELITNVIKHAKATEINIHFTEYNQVLNIMVEDNGIGFDASQNNKRNTGTGLLSIKRRVEKLEGKIIIESQPGNGTNIILDLPV